MTHTLRYALLGAALAAAPVSAQQVAPSSARESVAAAPAVSGDEALSMMHAALRSMVVAQERHYAKHGTYTTDLSVLGRYPPSQVAMRDSAYVTILFAGGRGWTGIATHRALRGRSCVMFVGSREELPLVPPTHSQGKQAAEEGEPTCDEP